MDQHYVARRINGSHSCLEVDMIGSAPSREVALTPVSGTRDMTTEAPASIDKARNGRSSQGMPTLPLAYLEIRELVQLFAIRKSSENSLSDPALGFTLKTVGWPTPISLFLTIMCLLAGTDFSSLMRMS
jgi:hypothetical protein